MEAATYLFSAPLVKGSPTDTDFPAIKVPPHAWAQNFQGNMQVKRTCCLVETAEEVWVGQKPTVKMVGAVKGLPASTCAKRLTARPGWLLVHGSSKISSLGSQGVKLAADSSCRGDWSLTHPIPWCSHCDHWAILAVVR